MPLPNHIHWVDIITGFNEKIKSKHQTYHNHDTQSPPTRIDRNLRLILPQEPMKISIFDDRDTQITLQQSVML